MGSLGALVHALKDHTLTLLHISHVVPYTSHLCPLYYLTTVFPSILPCALLTLENFLNFLAWSFLGIIYLRVAGCKHYGKFP